MNRFYGAFITVFVVLALCLCLAYAVIDTQAQHNGQLMNPYWPFTVETQTRDR